MKIWSENQCYQQYENCTRYLPTFIQLFHSISFECTSHALFQRAKDGHALAVSAFPLVSFLLYGDDHLNLPLLRYPSRTLGYVTPTNAKQLLCWRLWTFQVGFNHNLPSSQPPPQLGRFQLQWWYFPPPNVPLVGPILWDWLSPQIFEILSLSAKDVLIAEKYTILVLRTWQYYIFYHGDAR